MGYSLFEMAERDGERKANLKAAIEVRKYLEKHNADSDFIESLVDDVFGDID